MLFKGGGWRQRMRSPNFPFIKRIMKHTPKYLQLHQTCFLVRMHMTETLIRQAMFWTEGSEKAARPVHAKGNNKSTSHLRNCFQVLGMGTLTHPPCCHISFSPNSQAFTSSIQRDRKELSQLYGLPQTRATALGSQDASQEFPLHETRKTPTHSNAYTLHEWMLILY